MTNGRPSTAFKALNYEFKVLYISYLQNREIPMTASPEGYDVKAVEAWINDSINDLTPPFEWLRLEGGHSNLTYKLVDKRGREAVIRRPPQGQLLPGN